MNLRKRRLVITIDGPVGAGKSSVAKILAKRLGCRYVDSGAMYRAVACEALRRGLDLNNEDGLSALIDGMSLEFEIVEGSYKTLLDGRDITEEIRLPEVSQTSSRISVLRKVREKLVAWQRGLGEESGSRIVMEGRDIGTVVFPDADVKFFLEASLEQRARRRQRDLAGMGVEESLDEIVGEIQRRDERDSGRKISPLRPAVDCVTIDSTDLEIEEVVDRMLEAIREREVLGKEERSTFLSGRPRLVGGKPQV